MREGKGEGEEERGREGGKKEGEERRVEKRGREELGGGRWRERRRLPSGSIWLTRSVTMLLSASTDPSEMSGKDHKTINFIFRGDL